jgi:hypothetical protein
MIDPFIQENLFWKLFDIAYILSIIGCIGITVGYVSSKVGDWIRNNFTPKF